MAELLIKVDDGAGYADGDCLCAFNDRHIDCVHAQRLCHISGAGFASNGLRPPGTVAQDWLNASRQYRFERVSTYAIERVTIETGDRQLITGPEFDVSINAGATIHVTHDDLRNHRQYGKLTASSVAVLIAAVRLGLQAVQLDAQGLRVAGVTVPFVIVSTNPEQMDVPLFLSRRKKHDRHALFGLPGAEIWYGGRTDQSPATMATVWNAIETKTPRRRAESEFELWPLGRLDERHHLPIRLEDDFDDNEAADMVESIHGDEEDDGNGHMITPVIHKRKLTMKWDAAEVLSEIGVSEVQVRDKNQPVPRDKKAKKAKLKMKIKKVRP